MKGTPLIIIISVVVLLILLLIMMKPKLAVSGNTNFLTPFVNPFNMFGGTPPATLAVNVGNGVTGPSGPGNGNVNNFFNAGPTGPPPGMDGFGIPYN